MTNTPGDQPPEPEQPGRPRQEGVPGQRPSGGDQEPETPGYWEQQAREPDQQPTAPYAQQHLPGTYPTQPGQVQYAPDHPRATTSLVLGILGLVLCGVIAPFAWVIGRRTLFEIEDSNGRLGGRSAAQAGYILGIVGTVLLVIGVVVLTLYVVGMVAVFNTGVGSNL